MNLFRHSNYSVISILYLGGLREKQVEAKQEFHEDNI
jgi:hypothetical protein